jgi:hypothetical protein
MGYKVLGFAVWQGTKWYLRRRTQGSGRKAALAGVSVAVLAGVVVAGRRSAAE